MVPPSLVPFKNTETLFLFVKFFFLIHSIELLRIKNKEGINEEVNNKYEKENVNAAEVEVS